MRDEKKGHLRAYSSAVRQAIVERFPELANGWKEEPDGSLTFSMKSPSGGRFWIDTRRTEFIVGFEFPHRHFGSGDADDGNPDPFEDVRAAESFIRDLLSGKYKAVTWRRNGKYVQSMLLAADEDPPTPQSWLGRWWTRGCMIDVRHWA